MLINGRALGGDRFSAARRRDEGSRFCGSGADAQCVKRNMVYNYARTWYTTTA
ncbi:MAG: hypothetical protein LBM18_00500 [Oscillospiraceae bacterium]|nr:hypothetical protein [Oscillospiraceae bacterium]